MSLKNFSSRPNYQSFPYYTSRYLIPKTNLFHGNVHKCKNSVSQAVVEGKKMSFEKSCLIQFIQDYSPNMLNYFEKKSTTLPFGYLLKRHNLLLGTPMLAVTISCGNSDRPNYLFSTFTPPPPRQQYDNTCPML